MKRTLIVGGLVAVVIAALFWVPSKAFKAASVCPSCFGFHSVGNDIDMENVSNAEKIKEEVGLSTRQVDNFFRGRLAPVHILVCSTEPCYRRIEGNGGTSKAISWAGRALLLSPRGQNITIIAHELAHIELNHLLGPVNSLKIPAWFDEGLAVYVSDDRRYLARPGSKTRCLVSGSDSLPTSGSGWWNGMNRNPARAYALAACRASEWLSSHGGPRAIAKLIDDLKRGASFEMAYNT